MTTQKQTDPKPEFFDIWRSLKKGVISLYLNRHSLLPMTVVPILVTFITLVVLRTEPFGAEPSPFLLALIQIPADFTIGLFCSLIILIIMNAPRKDDHNGPVMFSLNIMDKKKQMITGAIGHVMFGYFSVGLYGAMHLLTGSRDDQPLPAIVPEGDTTTTDSAAATATAAQDAMAEQMATISGDQIFILFLTMIVGFYGVRFMLLPVLLVAEMDVAGFFRRYAGFGLSAPVFIVKFATTMAVGVALYIPASILLQGVEEDAMTMVQTGMIDLATAIGSVASFAWGYAALSIGLRQMLEQKR